MRCCWEIDKPRVQEILYKRTIRQATLAPIATAPAVPPRTALAPAFCMISLKDAFGFDSSESLMMHSENDNVMNVDVVAIGGARA